MILYNYKGHPNTLNKTLTQVGEINVTLRPELNTNTPQIKVVNPPQMYTYNYVFIPEFGKYYFVSNYKFIGGNTYLLNLQIDLLQTYKDNILKGSGLVVESDKSNPYISNRNNVYNIVPNTDKIEFPNKGLLNSDGKIIMITLKGTNN